MIYFLHWALKSQWRHEFPSFRFVAAQIASSTAMIFILYMAAKTLDPRADSALSWYGFDYFHYVITGEIGLTIPLIVMGSFTRAVKQAIQTKFLHEIVRMHWLKAMGRILTSALAVSLSSWFHFALLTTVAIFFQYQIELTNFLIGCAFMLLSLPCFIILGAAMCAATLATGRGEGLATQLNLILSIFAGAYFPIAIMGPQVEWLSRVMPPTIYLDKLRVLLSGGEAGPVFVAMAKYQIAFAIFFAPVAIFACRRALKKIRSGFLPETVIY